MIDMRPHLSKRYHRLTTVFRCLGSSFCAGWKEMRLGSPRPVFGARLGRLEEGSLEAFGAAVWAVRIGRSADGAAILCFGAAVLASRLALDPVRATGFGCDRFCFDEDFWKGNSWRSSLRGSWREADPVGRPLVPASALLTAVARLEDDATRRGGLAAVRTRVDGACPDWDAEMLPRACRSDEEFGRNDSDLMVRR